MGQHMAKHTCIYGVCVYFDLTCMCYCRQSSSGHEYEDVTIEVDIIISGPDKTYSGDNWMGGGSVR